MPNSSLSGKVAIVGVDESDRIGVVPDKSMLQLHAEGARNALRDAGLTLKDVDGLFTANISPAEVGEYLGIEPKVVDGTNVGGCAFAPNMPLRQETIRPSSVRAQYSATRSTIACIGSSPEITLARWFTDQTCASL